MNPEWVATIRRLAFKLAPHPNERDDLIQEGLMAVMHCTPETAKSYIATRARGAMVDYIRARAPLARSHYRELKAAGKPIPRLIEFDAFDMDASSPGANDDWASVQQQLTHLSTNERVVVWLTVEGYTLAEISQWLGVTASRACQLATSVKRKLAA